MEISVQEAMHAIKNYDERIDKLTREISFLTIITGDSVAIGYKSNSEFEETVKKNYQSLQDMIKRRAAIKSAIVISNATIDLVLGDQTMKVAEAIERKLHVKKDEALLHKMVSAEQLAIARIEKEKAALQPRIDALILQSVGANKAGKEDLVKSITDQFNATYLPKIIDPIGLKTVITKLTDEITEFKSKVNFVIDRSNIITMIQVPDN